MSASRKLTWLMGAVVICAPLPLLGTEEAVLDTDFLEYLGLWEESDEDWLLLDREAVADKEQRSEPVPEGEDSTETEDET